MGPAPNESTQHTKEKSTLLPFRWWRRQNAPIRAGFVLPFKEAQCIAPGWIYAGEMFDFSWETRPQSSSSSRFTAGASRLFILSQSGERPER
jgi:hypothetical protein